VPASAAVLDLLVTVSLVLGRDCATGACLPQCMREGEDRVRPGPDHEVLAELSRLRTVAATREAGTLHDGEFARVV
jgi:hypothetical protein